MNIVFNSKMDLKELHSYDTIKEIKRKIVYYENQKHLANQQLSIVRQELEDINYFFINFGYKNEFNAVTQATANDRVCKESQFDKITSDIYHFNKRLSELNDNLHTIYGEEYSTA